MAFGKFHNAGGNNHQQLGLPLYKTIELFLVTSNLHMPCAQVFPSLHGYARETQTCMYGEIQTRKFITAHFVV
jgi:hypothetical protein